MIDKIIIIIPTYNEVKNISLLLEKLFSLGLNLSILIVDDNSPDGTSKIVTKLQSKYPQLNLITRASRLGLGSAYIEGFNYALKRGFDIIIQMDADLSHSTNYIPDMISLLKEYDLVVGSRYIKDGGVLEWPSPRTLLSKGGNIFSKILLRVSINDLTSGFKCLRKTVLKKIDFNTISSKGYAFQIEMVFRALIKNFKVVEYPIIFQGRKHEESKMSLGIVLEAIFRVMCLSLSRFFRKYR